MYTLHQAEPPQGGIEKLSKLENIQFPSKLDLSKAESANVDSQIYLAFILNITKPL